MSKQPNTYFYPVASNPSTRFADLSLLLLLLFLFLDCTSQTSPGGKGTVVARVGRAVFTLEELEASIPEQMAQQISSEEKQEMAKRWVEKQLLYQEALRQGIERDPLVRKWIEQAKVDLVVNTLLKRELVGSSDITEEDIALYYDEHQDEFILENDEIWGRYIQTRTYQKARSIHQRLSRGASFEDVMVEGDSLEMSSGDLGYFSQGDIHEDLWKALSNVKVGGVSSPVKTPLGYHIIQVLDRKEVGTARELDEVHEHIMDFLLFERQRARVDQFVQRLRTETSCEINTELLSNHVQQ